MRAATAAAPGPTPPPSLVPHRRSPSARVANGPAAKRRDGAAPADGARGRKARPADARANGRGANGARPDGAAPRAGADAAAAKLPVPVLLDALRAIARELRLAEREVEHRLGLPPAQAQVLRHLGERSARSLGELADRTHTDPSSVSVVVQRLVERGVVVREAAADDRRRTELALTASGRALLRRLPASAAERLAAATAVLGEHQTTSLARGLSALARALDTDGADD